jgi:hypothetical protein
MEVSGEETRENCPKSLAAGKAISVCQIGAGQANMLSREVRTEDEQMDSVTIRPGAETLDQRMAWILQPIWGTLGSSRRYDEKSRAVIKLGDKPTRTEG